MVEHNGNKKPIELSNHSIIDMIVNSFTITTEL